jgi:hypothetical protein
VFVGSLPCNLYGAAFFVYANLLTTLLVFINCTKN